MVKKEDVKSKVTVAYRLLGTKMFENLCIS